jgi:hypothetical protein
MSSPAASLSKLPPALIAPLERAIFRQAAMAVVCWTALDNQFRQNGDAQGAARLPLRYFVELAAALQLHIWEGAGLRDSLPADLPSFEEAAADLQHRARTAPQDFNGAKGLQLAPRVLLAWVNQFAWAAPNFLQTDVVLGQADEDALVEATAQLFWRNRRGLVTKGIGNG